MNELFEIKKLSAQKKAYRIGDPNGRFPIFSADGSRISAGRWNIANTPVIYCSEHFSTAMLEKLVYLNGIMPKNQQYVEITIPEGTTYEVFQANENHDWFDKDCKLSREYGAKWALEKRSLLLLAPSVIARHENNIIINPYHDEFTNIIVSENFPIHWDKRLFTQ